MRSVTEGLELESFGCNQSHLFESWWNQLGRWF